MPTLITVNEERAEVRFPYQPDVIAELKDTVPTRCRSWDGARKCWLIDVSYVETVQEILSRHWPQTPARPVLDEAARQRAYHEGRAAGRAEGLAERKDEWLRGYNDGYKLGLKNGQSVEQRRVGAAPSGPYLTLHVEPQAPREIVDAAYRACAKLHHPDLADNGKKDDATRRMAAINAAYDAIRKQRKWA